MLAIRSFRSKYFNGHLSWKSVSTNWRTTCVPISKGDTTCFTEPPALVSPSYANRLGWTRVLSFLFVISSKVQTICPVSFVHTHFDEHRQWNRLHRIWSPSNPDTRKIYENCFTSGRTVISLCLHSWPRDRCCLLSFSCSSGESRRKKALFSAK